MEQCAKSISWVQRDKCVESICVWWRSEREETRKGTIGRGKGASKRQRGEREGNKIQMTRKQKLGYGGRGDGICEAGESRGYTDKQTYT